MKTKSVSLIALFIFLVILLITTNAIRPFNELGVKLAPQIFPVGDGTTEAPSGYSEGSLGGAGSCTGSIWTGEPRCGTNGNLEKKLTKHSLSCPPVDVAPDYIGDSITGAITAPDENGCWCRASTSWEEYEVCENGCEDIDGEGVCSPGGSGGDECVAPPEGLVSWWADDKIDVWDSNDGSALGGVGYTRGKAGEAISFDCIDDYIQVPDNDNLDFG